MGASRTAKTAAEITIQAMKKESRTSLPAMREFSLETSPGRRLGPASYGDS
jgi:hypothetical protein